MKIANICLFLSTPSSPLRVRAQTTVVAAARVAETVAADQRKLTLLNAYKDHKAKTEVQCGDCVVGRISER